jgi:retron-type reverse transcriptase
LSLERWLNVGAFIVVIIRTIGKWMNAGIMEERKIVKPETGVPQGGVISPLLVDRIFFNCAAFLNLI